MRIMALALVALFVQPVKAESLFSYICKSRALIISVHKQTTFVGYNKSGGATYYGLIDYTVVGKPSISGMTDIQIVQNVSKNDFTAGVIEPDLMRLKRQGREQHNMGFATIAGLQNKAASFKITWSPIGKATEYTELNLPQQTLDCKKAK